MKKNILFLISGVLTGIALCLTAAMLVPLDDGDIDPWDL